MNPDLTDAERSFVAAACVNPPTLTDEQLADLRAVLQPKVAIAIRSIRLSEPQSARRRAA
jgi:hypothetical protein